MFPSWLKPIQPNNNELVATNGKMLHAILMKSEFEVISNQDQNKSFNVLDFALERLLDAIIDAGALLVDLDMETMMRHVIKKLP